MEYLMLVKPHSILQSNENEVSQRSTLILGEFYKNFFDLG